MFTDARIRWGLEDMMQHIPVPPVPIAAVEAALSKQPERIRTAPRFPRFAIAAAAVITLVFVALPALAPAFVQSLEARYRAALQALGGSAPPPVPDRVLSKLSSQSADLATAQSRITFRLVPPAGLPSDVSAARIRTVAAGVYSVKTHTWQAGPMEVHFFYRRPGGREFMLIAEPYDPHGEMPGKYMFEATDTLKNGRPVLLKHEHFAWRNGGQMMSATEGNGLSALEIGAIRRAMHGIPLALRPLHAAPSGGPMKVHVFSP
jgi:hypothetical protein